MKKEYKNLYLVISEDGKYYLDSASGKQPISQLFPSYPDLANALLTKSDIEDAFKWANQYKSDHGKDIVETKWKLRKASVIVNIS